MSFPPSKRSHFSSSLNTTGYRIMIRVSSLLLGSLAAKQTLNCSLTKSLLTFKNYYCGFNWPYEMTRVTLE